MLSTWCKLNKSTNAKVLSKNVRNLQRRKGGSSTPRESSWKGNQNLLHPVTWSIFFKNKAISLLLWLVCFHGEELALVAAFPGWDKWVCVELCGDPKAKHDCNPRDIAWLPSFHTWLLSACYMMDSILGFDNMLVC